MGALLRGLSCPWAVLQGCPSSRAGCSVWVGGLASNLPGSDPSEVYAVALPTIHLNSRWCQVHQSRSAVNSGGAGMSLANL